MRKITAIGVRPGEFELYKKINKEHGFEINCYGTDQDIYDESIYNGADYVISGNSTSLLSDRYFSMLEKNGIRFFLAKMTGINQIDLEAAKKHNVHVANVRGYSPNAISELAMAMAFSLNRNLYTIQLRNKHDQFAIDYPYFKEVRDCVIGIYGVGQIGMTTAKLFNMIGSNVIGFDPHPKEINKTYIKYVDMESLAKQSDILIIHAAYSKEKNYHIIDGNFINGMKNDAILINVARGELVDLKAVNKAIKSGKLKGYGADVLENEDSVYGKDLEEVEDETIDEAISLYPKVIITPHIGAHTIHARESQIQIALTEIGDFQTTGSCQYMVV